MSRDHRLVLGNVGDIADGRATDRIVEALDYEHDRRVRAARIAAVLRRLNAADRAFVRAVLAGKGWREMGLSRQLFEWRVRKFERIFRSMADTPEGCA